MYGILLTILLIAFAGGVPVQQSPSDNTSKDSTKPIVATAKTGEIAEKESQLPNKHILENPSYDPNLYSSFIPQEGVQQYVSTYTGPYAPAYVPTFTVQQGYEGYLVPQEESTEVLAPGVLKYLSDILPQSALGWVGKVVASFLTVIGVIFFGGAITSAFCNLTNMCSISFAGMPFLQLRSTAETLSRAFGQELTPETIGQTAEFVQAAINKFSELQNNYPRKND